MICRSIAIVFHSIAIVFLFAVVATPGDVLTQRSNNFRTGMVEEPGLDASAVSRWRKLGDLRVQGRVNAQPLYVDGVPIRSTGRSHKAVFIATSDNNIYAFDALSLVPLWTPISLGPNDRSVIGAPGCDSLSRGIGIEATPVIDKSTGMMYVSWRSNPASQKENARLLVSGIDIRDGRKALGPVEVQGVPPVWHRSRASLLLEGGVVYVAFGSRCEDPGQPIFHGWIVAFDAKTLRQVGIFQTTPGDIDGGGIWQASSGLVSDGSSIYFSTGNRRPEIGHTPLDTPNLANAVVRVQVQISKLPDGSVGSASMHATDWFQPYRKVWLDRVDMDLASSGPLMVPGTNFLVAGGKQGMLYVLDRTNLGKLDPQKKWDRQTVDQLKPDTTIDQRPEDYAADKVVQKFQVGFQQYIPAYPTHLAQPGSPVASQDQREVFVVGRDKAVYVTWKVNAAAWSDGIGGRPGPARITPAQQMPLGAHLASAKPVDNQMEVFYIGNDGAVHTTWKVNNGRWTDGLGGFRGPAQITPAGQAPPGGCLAAAKPTANQLEVFYIGNDGAVHTTWKVNNGRWTDGLGGFTGPAQITPRFQTPSAAGVVSNKPGENNLEVLYVGNDGALHVTLKVNNGRWTDGLNKYIPPGRLSRALWMNDWGVWPHIHGTPVFARFRDGSAMLYVWPEKDHLKAFRWQGTRFDVQGKILAVDRARRLVVGPDGMPGGMLTAAIDTRQPRAGVLFAAQTLTAETEGPGMLRAFDAVTLVELWNNQGENYQFNKFVPPTVAAGRVFLPTSSGAVLVYGDH